MAMRHTQLRPSVLRIPGFAAGFSYASCAGLALGASRGPRQQSAAGFARGQSRPDGCREE